ncbi:hypothetical protein FOA52_007269 [Chlamydomonas sp. UWO 241]|nr:hypothetical protein FOA52_007269 [Chlamydomonas sp. UWO 241]
MDIGKFEASGITQEMVVEATAYPCGGFIVSILNNQMFVAPIGWEMNSGWEERLARKDNHHALAFILKAMCHYTLPDMTFVLNTFDKLCREDLEHPSPVLSWGKDVWESDHQIMFPYWTNFDMAHKLAALKLPGPDWSNRMEGAVWRGTSTGGISIVANFDEFSRFKLVTQCMNSSVCDAKFSTLVQMNPETQNLVTALGAMGGTIPMHEWLSYKYIIVNDGNLAPSSRITAFMHSGSAMLWQESHTLEFFYEKLEPYVHYIPVSYNFGDLLHKIRWAQSHDAQAKKIADNAKAFAEEHFTKATFECYLARVLRRYAAAQRFAPGLFYDGFKANTSMASAGSKGFTRARPEDPGAWASTSTEWKFIGPVAEAAPCPA